MLRKLSELHEKARGHSRRRLVLAAAHDAHAMGAVIHAHQNKLIEGILIGDEPKINDIASENNYDLSPLTVINEPDNAAAAARAVKMVGTKEADILMKGNLSTAILLKAVLNKEYGLRTGEQISHLALFELPAYHKLIGLTDAAMNIAPELAEKVSITRNAVEYFRKLGIEKPKVAMLSAVETVNPAMKSSMEASVIAKMGDRGQIKNCIIDGPLAFDNAISKKSAELKCITSPVAGDADLLVADDIDVANGLYKAFIYFAGARGAAVILGAAAPIVLTSRADNDETKLNSIALAAAVNDAD
ncbi:MAG: bifunctional enoyl-CoA hydratase/phosphate acetyltransferase [Bacteroidales bacterium]